MRHLIQTLSLAALSAAASVIVPAARGQYGTASSTLLLCDESRQDPYAAALNISERRRVMLSSFYPTGPVESCKAYNANYTPPATAAYYDDKYASIGIPRGSFASLQLQFCRPERYRPQSNLSFPVVLFSPGLGETRLHYSAMAQSLAGRGFIVITIDHPYDADIVEFPDGSTVMGANITSLEQIAAAVRVRVADVLFVLAQLGSRRTRKQLFGPNDWAHNRAKVSVIGHSLGGATAVASAFNKSRLAAAVNLDGTQFGPIPAQGSRVPMLIMANQIHNLTSDPTWATLWNASRQATKLVVKVDGAQHGAFSDYPVILDVVPNLPQSVVDVRDSLVGTISGSRAQEIVSTFVGQFLSYALGGSGDPLPRLDGGNNQDVQLLNATIRPIEARF